uniref:Uncharacterized protein ycf35 n=1 Tax=Wrangelia sp. TaxID=2575620 RepID=A0A4D6X1X1_9FLOR|nr:hypothetical protein [Wrangelia sp.]
MSHFSKIKTNISRLGILEKTLQDFEFKYYINDSSTSSNNQINVYNKSLTDNDLLFSFVWDGYQYSLAADLQLWNLSVNFSDFLEKFNQRYAYNVILEQSKVIGYQKIDDNLMTDGSYRVILQKWDYV